MVQFGHQLEVRTGTPWLCTGRSAASQSSLHVWLHPAQFDALKASEEWKDRVERHGLRDVEEVYRVLLMC